VTDEPPDAPDLVAFTCWSCGNVGTTAVWQSALLSGPIYEPAECPTCGELNDVPRVAKKAR
jgi:hypothetical protein